ncbi:hypothetical protein [Nocardia heshunensis]
MPRKPFNDSTGNANHTLLWPDPSPLSSWWDNVMELPHGDPVPKPQTRGAHDL